jgi:hypothetical protein
MKKLMTFLSAAALLSMSCYSIKIVNGKPIGAPAPGYEEKLHFGVIAGIIELSGPYNLDQICPNGWAEAGSQLSIVSGVLHFVIPFVDFQSVSIKCTGGGAYRLQMNPDGTANVLEVLEPAPYAALNQPQ